jgi:hypothetical protein
MSNTPNDNELEKLAPTLARLPKKERLEAPTGYFEGLPGALLDTLQAGKSLYSIDKKETIVAPEGYFEGLSQSVLSKIKEDRNDKKLYPIYAGRWRKLAVAASIALVGVFSYQLFFKKEQETLMASTPGKASIEQCTQYLADELPVYDLEDFMDEQNIEVSDSVQTQQDVVDYLMNESTEFELENL